MKVHLDFEACSELDLKQVGAWEWTRHVSTRAICAAFALDGPVYSWLPGKIAVEQILLDAVSKGAEVHAWNAPFEHAFWNNVMVPLFGWPALPIDRFHCTMATAANYGLPMSLDQAAPAVGASFVKDKAGSLVMKRMARPRSYDKQGMPVWWHDTDPQKLSILRQYNIGDVHAERAISDLIPRMTPEEREVWLCDQRMNLRGFAVDTRLLDALQTLTEAEMKRLSDEICQLTNGEVTSVTQNARIVEWISKGGLDCDSVAKDALDTMLGLPGLSTTTRRVLEIRQEAGKSSTAKLGKMGKWAGADKRIRYMVQYYGALRTGRWAGRGPQVQNFPRPIVKQVGLAIDQILDGCDADTINEFFGRPLDVVSSALRGCLVAAPGHALTVCDFSQIEARVVCWLAGQNDILAVFASGQDVYVYTAKKINSDNRQLGKVAVLGLGFGMGGPKFVDAAATYGITLTEARAIEIVTQWREANDQIVKFWWDCGDAAMRAIKSPGRVFMVGPADVNFEMGSGLLSGCLLIWLPSGRRLVYRNARLEIDNGRYSIVYDGLDQYTRKWGPIRTYGGKLVENITQAVARDLMADAMLRMDAAGLPLVATIHDELIAEVPTPQASPAFSQMKSIMSNGPRWSRGLPLGGEGFVAARYGK